MAFDRTFLTKIAQHPEPETFLPPNVYAGHSAHTVTIFDAYPKADYHFLVLPRLPFPSPFPHSNSKKKSQVQRQVKVKVKTKSGMEFETNLNLKTEIKTKTKTDKDLDEHSSFVNLQTFFRAPGLTKAFARAFFEKMKEDGEALREEVEEDMRLRRGFVSELYFGFHAVPSMDHLHMHIISSDLCSPHLKTKKHYNSFHPSIGFFLHLDDILSWLEGPDLDSDLAKIAKRLDDSSGFEAKLKEPLRCLHCAAELKTIPRLTEHLQDHFEEKMKEAEAEAETETLQ